MVPWAFVAYLDYGWFVLLGLTVVFLPDSPPLYFEMSLAYDRTLTSETQSIFHLPSSTSASKSMLSTLSKTLSPSKKKKAAADEGAPAAAAAGPSRDNGAV